MRVEISAGESSLPVSYKSASILYAFISSIDLGVPKSMIVSIL